ncbi:MAG: phosphate/phosphite/phosphonate ABC transporter substrate-binding protein [Bauldia sp.]|nr:phosphate/phosphite/phosphonate ABC transporter substrate-binding protein [Bauldia sp.]
MPILRRLVLAGIAIFALSGVAAAQAWREEVPTLRVGILAGENQAYTLARVEPFRLYLEARLGIDVEIVPGYDYPALIAAQTNAGVHATFLSATAYATARAACNCVEPVVIPTTREGDTGFYAIMVAPAGGPVRDLDDLAGRRLAVSTTDSVAGRLLPLRLFADAGMGQDRFDLVQRDAPAAAVAALAAGEADAALAWSSMTGSAATGYRAGVLAQMVAAGTLVMADIAVVWRSPEIPNPPLVVQSALPEDLKTALRNAMVELRTADPAALDAIDGAYGGGYRPATASEFAPLVVLFERPAE